MTCQPATRLFQTTLPNARLRFHYMTQPATASFQNNPRLVLFLLTPASAPHPKAMGQSPRRDNTLAKRSTYSRSRVTQTPRETRLNRESPSYYLARSRARFLCL